MKKNILIVLIGILMLVINSFGYATEAPLKHINVYYFFTNVRCSRCYAFEKFTKEALERYFTPELNSGKIIFKPLNIDQKENQHFMKEYQLYTKAVVISMVNGDKEIKHKNLPKIWEYVGDKEKFYNYIKTETNQYLEEVK
jgi:hypothetical protein